MVLNIQFGNYPSPTMCKTVAWTWGIQSQKRPKESILKANLVFDKWLGHMTKFDDDSKQNGQGFTRSINGRQMNQRKKWLINLIGVFLWILNEKPGILDV
jgi:hypothetical protein